MRNNTSVSMLVARPVVSSALRILLAATLALAAVLATGLAVPSVAHAFNGYLEDCDFDGRDDETGVTVPWPGFDETRGDVVPANWDRVNGVEKSPPDPAPSQNPPDPAPSQSPSGTTTNDTADTASPAAPHTGSGQPTNTGGPASGTGTDANAPQDSTADPAEADAAIAAVVNKKGSLAVTSSEADAAIRPGSTLTLKGSGFAGSAKGLTIELSPSSLSLGTVDSLDDGSFELDITLPRELATGRHNLVVSYQGYPIIQKSITVGEAATTLSAAATPAEAPAPGGVPLGTGIAIIAVLTVVAAGLLVVWKLKKDRIAAQAD
jgi:hypothetical protein